MSNHDHKHDDWLRDLPVDLDTLAAVVEGDLGHEEADAVLERLLKADPALAHRVELMCQDRVVLRTLGDEQPPAGLAESVITRLEREALLGLAQGEASGSIPISRAPTVRTSQGNGIGRWLTSPAGAGLAMAAVLALGIGVTLQLLPGGGTPQPEEVGPLALNESTSAPEQAMRQPESPPRAVAGEAAREPQDREFVADVSPADPQPAILFADDPDRALALLGEGRLLVRVRCADPDAAVGQMARLASLAGHPGEAWRLGDEVTEPIALAMQSKFEPPAAPHEPLVIADDGRGADATRTAPPRVEAKASPLGAVYLADVRADSAAVRSLRAALSLGDRQWVEFEELREPLELPRVLTPESVLWWGRPAEEWARRVYVPVVVERVD